MKDSQLKTLRTVCPMNCYCGFAIQAVFDDGRLIRIKGAPGNPITRGKLCMKGYSYLKLLNDSNRIQYPMKQVGVRETGKFVCISWDEAIHEIHTKLYSLRARYGPKSVF